MTSSSIAQWRTFLGMRRFVSFLQSRLHPSRPRPSSFYIVLPVTSLAERCPILCRSSSRLCAGLSSEHVLSREPTALHSRSHVMASLFVTRKPEMLLQILG